MYWPSAVLLGFQRWLSANLSLDLDLRVLEEFTMLSHKKCCINLLILLIISPVSDLLSKRTKFREEIVLKINKTK